MDIHVADWGIDFVRECLSRFQGQGYFLYFFAMALIIIVLSFKKREWIKGPILYGIGLVLSVFNPLVVNGVVSKLSLDDEYYRFFWLLPVTVVIAGFVVWLLQHGVLWKKILLAGIMMVLLAVPGKSIRSASLQTAENLYKIPDEYLQICDIIQTLEKSGFPDLIHSTEETVVYADFNLAVVMNQIDPSIVMALSYGDVADFKASYDATVDYDGVFSSTMISKWYLYQLYELGNNEGMIPPVMRSFAWLHVDYVVLNKTNQWLENTISQHCEPVAETENYVIMRYLGEEIEA